MYPDFEALLFELNEHRVKYLLVGGYAVSRYAQPRATKDLDIFIEATPKNAVALFEALQAFGAPLGGHSPDDLIEKGSFFRMGSAPVAIDILPEIDGMTFRKAWRSRVEAVINPQTGVKALFISRDDLITAKLAAGRSRDLADVDELRVVAAGQPSKKSRKPSKAMSVERPRKPPSKGGHRRKPR